MSSGPYLHHPQLELSDLRDGGGGEPTSTSTRSFRDRQIAPQFPPSYHPSSTYYRREAHTRDQNRDFLCPPSPTSPGHDRTSTISCGKDDTETLTQRLSNVSPDQECGYHGHYYSASRGGGGTPAPDGSVRDDYDQVEYPPMPEDQKLGYISTACLIISNMVGTGVFAKAPIVLEGCGSKGVSLLLWLACGGLSFLGLSIYIELGIAFPFNGAEIVYTEELYPRPRFLAVTVVGMLVILLKNNAANALQFSKMILEAFEPSKPPDPRLEKFLGFIVITGVCLLHLFSRKIGVAMNTFLALYKIGLMIFIVLVGFAAMGGAGGKTAPGSQPQNYGLSNFSNAMQTQKKSLPEFGNAILGVLWAYYGWDNANYVLAEVRRPPRDESRVFKRACLSSLGLLTVLYVLCNVSYYVVLSDDELGVTDELVAIRFLRKFFGDGWFIQRGLHVVFALSILGNFIAYTYGVSRVKQEIAKLKILPFSKFWARQSQYDTPVGALTLHWIFGSATIIFTPNNNGKNDTYNLITNLYTFTQDYTYIIVALSIFSLKYHPKFRDTWLPKFLPWPLLASMSILYVMVNVFIIIITWWPLKQNSSSIPHFVTPGTATGFLLFGVFYWFCYSQVLPLLGWHVDYRPDEMIDGSRIVSFRVHKTGFAKKLSDWLDDNVLRRRRQTSRKN